MMSLINYSVDKMVLVSLNLNEYHMPTSTISIWTLYIWDCKMGVFVI